MAADEELLAANRRLEQRVRELQREVDEAGRAARTRGRFLSSAGHDLRQPLQTLGILVDILRRRIAEPELLALVDRQENALWSLRELLESFLDLNRVDLRAIEPEQSEFLMRDLLDEVRDAYGPETARRDIRLKVIPCTTVVRSDPVLLRRVVGCLVSTAMQHSGTRRIVVGCRRRGDRLRLEVWDAGGAVAPEQMAAVLKSPQTPRTGGSAAPGFGLGLSLARELADLLEVGLELRPVPGGGHVFTVALATGDAWRTPVRPGNPVRRFEGNPGMRVMVVEDDRQVLDATCLALSNLGLKAISAASAPEAMARLDRGAPPDIVIADYDLGDEGSGIDIIRRIRQELGRDIPALLITGDAAPDSIRDIEASGCRYFQKPVLVDELVAQMNRLSGQ